MNIFEPLVFDQVYSEHFRFVWRVLRSLGVRDEQAEDAAQEVFVVVHRRLSEFDGRVAVTTWLFAIARRVAADFRKRQQKRTERHAPLSEHTPDGKETPEDAAAAQQSLELLQAVLDELGDDRRAVFVLVEIEQMSIPEVAEILELKLNTAYSRLRRAREDFERALQRRLEGSPR